MMSLKFPILRKGHMVANNNREIGEPVDEHGESVINHINTCPDSADLAFEVCSG